MSNVLYKGVNLAGMEFGSGNRVNVDYVVPGKTSYDYWAQDVGSNIIRLPFTWERLQPQAYGNLDQEYLGYLKQSVSWAKANGMTIALDLHNYARYNGQVTDSGKLTDVWKKIAKEFGGDDSVWFNLMNEPYNVSASQWANTTQQTVNSLRAAGIDNMLLLSGTSWSGAHSWISSGNAAAYDNFRDPLNKYAFDVHQYLDRDSSGFSAEAIAGSGSTRLIKVTEWAEAKGHKLFLGEAGVGDNAQAIKEMGDMMQYMENHSGAWLGWTLWGAGPWWGNYYLEINPQGSEHDPAIAALMKYMKPGTAPDPTPGPTPDPDPTPTPGDGQTFSASTNTDKITGTSGDDTVQAYKTQLNPDDSIVMGAGYDTLYMRSGSYTFDSSLYKGLKGIDHLDMTVSGSRGKVILDEAFLRSTDADAVTISFGAGRGTLDTSRLAAGSFTVKWDGNTAKVTLTNAPDPQPNPDPDPTPTPTPVEGQTFNASSNTDKITGTSGDDTVLAYGTQLNPADSIVLGAGYDTIQMRSGSYTFDSSLFKGLKGVDHLDMTTPSTKAKIILDEAFLRSTDAGAVTISFGAGRGTLDTSRLAAGSFTVKWDGNTAKVALTDSTSPQPNPDPDPNPDPTPTPVPGQTFSASSNTDKITGTTGDDIVQAYSSQLNPADSIVLGAGYDTIQMRSGSYTFDSSLFKGLKGVDHLDMTVPNDRAKVILDEAFLRSTDAGAVTVTFGPDGRGTLDTSRLAAGSFTVKWDGNTAKVALTNTLKLASFLADSDQDEVAVNFGAPNQINGGSSNDALHGSAADDTLYGNDGMDFLYGHDGNDILVGGRGADTLNGGAGNDVFRYTDMADAGDIIQDFEAGDKIDLTELLAANGMASVEEALADGKMSVTQKGADVEVGFNGITLATVENVNTDDLLFTNMAASI